MPTQWALYIHYLSGIVETSAYYDSIDKNWSQLSQSMIYSSLLLFQFAIFVKFDFFMFELQSILPKTFKRFQMINKDIYVLPSRFNHEISPIYSRYMSNDIGNIRSLKDF